MKRLMLMGLCFSGAAALASGQTVRHNRSGDVHAQYRIVTTDGMVVLSRDLPRQQGSVVTYHDDRSGALTGLPSERIARIDTGVTPQRFPARSASSSPGGEEAQRPLQPGEVMVLGPMGDGASGVSIAGQTGAGAGDATAGGANAGANSVSGNGAYGGGNFVNGNGNFDTRMLGGRSPTPATGLLPNGQPSNQPLAGDVLRAQSGNVPTMSIDTQTQTSSNGFPANAASQAATVNPNGTPNISTTGPVAGSTAPVGPNGFPGTPQNVTGPNGFPTTGGAATNPQTGVGPNGFPATGTAGTTTQQNVTNPNGFPAVGAPGTGTTNGNGVVVAPNGTPATAAPQQPQPQSAQPHSGASSAPKGGASSAPSGGAAGASSGSGPSH